jgi:hypothetical protein
MVSNTNITLRFIAGFAAALDGVYCINAPEVEENVE